MNIESNFKCKVCLNALVKIKYIKSEITAENIALYKCKNCNSYFSNIKNDTQQLVEFNKTSIDVYMNKDYVTYRTQDIFNYSKKKMAFK